MLPDSTRVLLWDAGSHRARMGSRNATPTPTASTAATATARMAFLTVLIVPQFPSRESNPARPANPRWRSDCGDPPQKRKARPSHWARRFSATAIRGPTPDMLLRKPGRVAERFDVNWELAE